MNEWTQQLERWHDFYLLMGGASATLMGLTFVAVTLGPDVIAARASGAVRAFVTPIVAFFATVLVVSVVLLIPLLMPAAASALLALTGATGLIYIPSTNAQAEWRKNKFGIDDWIWYIGLPLLGYAVILFSAVAWWRTLVWAPYAIAAAILCLLLAGIRDAWDLVIALALERQK